MAELQLTAEQLSALPLCLDMRTNVFITGGAGTGKSALLRHTIRELGRELGHDTGKLAVTASTGAAALQIGGCTLHSFVGIGLGTGSPMECAALAMRNKKVKKRWVDARVLVIDEISMVSQAYMTKVDAVARACRGVGLPMGGLKVILCGDFLQLPPVERPSGDVRLYTCSWWDSMKIRSVLLQQCIRQVDENFAAGLNDMRMGRTPCEPLLSVLEGRGSAQPAEDLSGATRLRCLKSQVAEYNAAILASLDDRATVTYAARDIGADPSGTLSRSCPLPPTIELKVGALVMLTRNLSRELINGSVGRVIRFTEAEDGSESLPLVALEQPDGRVVLHVIGREMSDIKDSYNTIIWSRNQIPLILAWAVTVHKVQGATLPRAEVDLAGCFDTGQAYVACSRVPCISRMRVTGFRRQALRADPIAVKYYSELESQKTKI